MGIYQIRCIPTGKIYIGSTVNLRYRWEKHRYWLRRGEHHNIYLQSAWDKYGEQNFEFSVLELVESSQLLRAEQEWMDKTGCADMSKHMKGLSIPMDTLLGQLLILLLFAVNMG